MTTYTIHKTIFIKTATVMLDIMVVVFCVLKILYDDLTGGFGTLNYCSYICEQKQA